MNMDRRNRYSRSGSNSIVKNAKILDLNIDVQTLDLMCRMIVSSNKTIRRGQLVNMRNLLAMINQDNYINDSEKSKRISFIMKGIEGRLVCNLTDPYMIMMHINGDILDSSIIDLESFKDLSSAEIEWINTMVSESLKFSHAYNNSDRLLDVCTRLKTSDYGTKNEIVKEMEDIINKTQNDFRRARNESQTEQIFSLRDGYFENIMYDTYNTLNSPRRKLITGMQGLNELLGGGFENGRCYAFFGLPGEGKSSTILNIMYQIKKYNRSYKTKDPTKRPCIVLLTMENSVTESIDRLFGMATNHPHMTDYTPDDAIRMMRNEGDLYLSDVSPIDIIIQFKPPNSVDTSYLYTITEDLEDQGLEVIAMFQDYIGRIRSTERLQDTRLEYGAVVDEFKVFAEIKDIPVITVAQLNRDAAKHIDESKKASKSDLVRVIGRSNISESMLVLNNIDGGFLIAPEVNQDGERFIGIQRIKKRYDASEREFLYIPFEPHSIKLVEDIEGIAKFRTTMRPENPFSSMQTQSQYHTNTIMDMGQIMNSTTEDANIFSTEIVNSSNSMNFNSKIEEKKLKDPIIFY